MVDTLPALPDGMTRKDLNSAHIMAMEDGDGEPVGGIDDFEAPHVVCYNVWVDDVEPGVNPVEALDRDFFVRDYPSREAALAAARKYAWQIAAKYNLEIEEY